jgi:multiple sugar transport system substrate-binding protein
MSTFQAGDKQEQKSTRRQLCRRDVLRLALSAAGGGLLAACGATSGGATSGGATSGAATDNASAPAAADGSVITITQWYHEYGEAGTQQAAQRYAEEYSQVNPKVKVNMVWVPGDYEFAKLPAALLTPEGPDVFEGHPTLAMVRAGQIAPLDDLFTEEVKQDFHPNNLAANTIEGKIYAVKMIDDMGLLYYRTSLLEQAGVQPPTTMDEVIAAAQQLSSARVKGLFVGNDGGVDALHQIGPWSAGSEFLTDNTISFDNERTVEAYRKVKELNDTGALLIGSPTDWWDPSALTQGLAAMQWTGLWAMPGIKAAIGDDFGVMAWPALDANGTPATFWGGWSQMVNAKSKYVEEAKAFVRWLWIENTKNQQDWSLAYGFHVPPRLSAAASAEPLKSGPAAQAVEYLGSYGKVNSPLWTSAMTTTVKNALGNIVKNGADAQGEVTLAAQQCQAELDALLQG